MLNILDSAHLGDACAAATAAAGAAGGCERALRAASHGLTELCEHAVRACAGAELVIEERGHREADKNHEDGRDAQLDLNGRWVGVDGQKAEGQKASASARAEAVGEGMCSHSPA